MENDTTDWKSIIYRGIESDELDYKAAQNWHKLSRGGRAKFARHCIAMANTKGGYVVVGVGEDINGQPSVFTGLDEEESRSFDPTDVGTFINRFADPAVDFTLERPMVDGKRFVVFVIRRFRTVPHVCTSSCDSELQLGTFYIRTSDASSRPAFRSSEIHALIQRALRNQRELLGRMIRGILYEDHSFQDERHPEAHFLDELAHSSNFFSKHRDRSEKSRFRLSLSVLPPDYVAGRYNLSELKEGMRESFRLFPSPVFLNEDDIRNAYSTNVSLRSLSEENDRGWQLYESGLFHFFAQIPLKENGVPYQTAVRLFAEFVPFAAHLYDRLGFSEEILKIQVNARDVENRALTEIPFGPKKSEFICRIPEIQMKLERSAADLLASPGTHAAELVRRFCERFNLPAGRHADLRKMVNDILSGTL